MVSCLGISRELTNSPNRETDDALILKAVMEQLAIYKARTRTVTPEEADAADLGSWDMIVPMCESYPRLRRLIDLRRSHPVLMVNPPDSVLACYRLGMYEAFARDPNILFPATETRTIQGRDPLEPPRFPAEAGLWVKRGDVHNTCTHDVVYAGDWSEVEAIRQDFAAREIASLVLQQHVDGDLVKFYGVGPGRWFTYFYHDPSTARKFPFDIDILAAMASAGAAALKLEIFGGDAIITPQGRIYLIDMNSWPSFARVRGEAAIQIAWQLRARLKTLQAVRRP
ncbi:MAG: hypothetical protein PHF00_03640 [Elusimicrobia bacterium]|nr:hypothetical protein [Elusimicrobiota bacterium]